jgi:hypothetical protein
MADLTYPTVQRLEEIEQDLLPTLTLADPVFSEFPIEDDADDVLRWEQMDNYKGLQAIRGLNGDPPNVTRTGLKSYLATPGVFGEYETVDEREITKRRKSGTFDQRIDITDIVLEMQNHLLTRELDRMRYQAWTLAATGTITTITKDGVTLYSDAFPLQTYTAAVPWGPTTTATATPLFDLRTVKLLARGHSVDFGSTATVYANQTTVNYMLNNTNAADLGGKRVLYGATVNALPDANRLYLENGLPQVVPYDGGYYNEAGQFVLFIPNNVAILFGKRPNGRPVGAYRRVFNAVSKSPGSYMQVLEDPNVVPPRVTVHRGHSGGVVVRYPSSIVIMKV